MSVTFRIQNLRPAEYLGYTRPEEQSLSSPFKVRLSAVDYSGECEVFVARSHVFPELEMSLPLHIRSTNVIQGHVMDDYTGGWLNKLMDDVDEKVSQWGSVAPAVRGAARDFEAQLVPTPPKRFTFLASVRRLESEIEHYCFKVISILDLYARIAHVFNAKSPQKFGQQLADTTKGRFWDKGYQDFLQTCDALIEPRDYRNALGHEVSLKLRPIETAGSWRAVLIREYIDTKGLLLYPFLEHLETDFVRYIQFFDHHFAAKAVNLNQFASMNAL
jgi:hypothetical protein